MPCAGAYHVYRLEDLRADGRDVDIVLRQEGTAPPCPYGLYLLHHYSERFLAYLILISTTNLCIMA
jgi:hypothetical protein